MSIRQSPQLTSPLLDAARSNGRRSHGPRSEAGKHHSRMNALQHGERSDPENRYDVMRALGEDPAEFESLKQELSASFGLGDPSVEMQVDDLTSFYWRRQRIERMETGLMRRALLELEERQQRRRKEIEGATITVGWALEVAILKEPSDPGARLRLRLSYLQAIRAQVERRCFYPWQAQAVENVYGRKGGWRGARLGELLALFANPDIAARLWAEPSDPQAPELTEVLWYKELLRLLEEEMASVAEEFEYEEKRNEEKVAIERDACLAPSGEEWRMLLRREESLDRAIDRKIKLLLMRRKSSTGTPADPTCSTGTPAGAGVSGAGGLETGKSACPTPIEEPSRDEEPSPEGRGCQAAALSSAGA